MDGTQSPGINYNSIDGLTTVAANSIIINGSTINLANYIPYTGATSSPNFNTYLLRNIGNAILSTDAVAFGQLGSYIPYTGATSNPDFNTKQLKNIGDGTLSQDAITLTQLNAKRYDTIQNGAADVYVNCGLTNLTLTAGALGKINTLSKVNITPSADATDVFNVNNAAGASKFYVDTSATNRTYATTAMTVRPTTNTTSAFDVKDSALTSLFTINTTTPTINCLTTLSMNSSKITNLANGTASADAVNYSQLSSIPSLPAATIQGSYVIYSGSAYINNATTTVNLGELSGNSATNATNIGGEAGKTSQATDAVAVGYQAGTTTQGAYSVAVGSNTGWQVQSSGATAVGAYAGQYYQGNTSLGSPVMNFDASALTTGTITSWANQGSYGTSGCVGTIGAGGTVYADTYLGGLKGVSLPATTQLSISVGAGVVYPNFTVAYVYKLTSGTSGSFIEQGTSYNTTPAAFYLTNGVIYSSPPLYYTNLSVGGAFIGIDSSASPYGPGISIGQGSTQTYIISIISYSGTSYFVQWYALDGATGVATSYGPYTQTGYSYGAATCTNPIYINQRITAQQNPLQILVYNSTFTQVQVNRLQEYLINKWFRRTTTVDNVAVGYSAAYQSQGYGAVAIGALAGSSYQGDNAVAIGNKAGQTSQVAGSIVVSASGVDLSPAKAGCYINPIRNDTDITILPSELMYNTQSYEIIRYDKPYWSLWTSATSGGYYCFTYVTNLPATGYYFDMNSTQYSASVDTGYGTAVWEGSGLPLTRKIAITIPYTGIYQINGSFAPNGTSTRIVVGLEIGVGGKVAEICDFVPADGLTSVSFAGTYYFTANTVLRLQAVVNTSTAISFSGHLVRRLQN
jgi:hypothetical protein